MDIMADPAHLAAEVTLMLLVDFLFLGLVWPFLKRWMNNRVHAEHRVLDAEHGVDHHPPRRGVHLRGDPLGGGGPLETSENPCNQLGFTNSRKQ